MIDLSHDAKMFSGIILITVPSIQYGGVFLLGQLRKPSSGYMQNPLRQNLFRAGHAHAGVLVILSLVCQVLADAAQLPEALIWFVRIGVPSSAILIPMGFFFSVAPPSATKPNGAINLVYIGALILAVSVVVLGAGLIRAAL
jgi:hypothetical protein